MDKFPLLLEGRPAGELSLEQEGLYTCFTARCILRPGLWCAWAVGDRGELRLGVLEPSGDQGVIRRRFSRRLTEPLGRLLRGEARPAALREAELWEPAPDPERLFQAPWLRQRLRGAQGALTRREGGGRLLALPWNSARPFPLTALFCFACFRDIGGNAYAVYAFDAQERPVFSLEKDGKNFLK